MLSAVPGLKVRKVPIGLLDVDVDINVDLSVYHTSGCLNFFGKGGVV